jgi:SAM-dependent methyltransferase
MDARALAAELAGRASKARADRALARQLAYQKQKARALAGLEERAVRELSARTAALRARLEEFGPIARDARVLEVGSGAHGHVFFFREGGPSSVAGADACDVGVDPLADEYRALFAWQARAKTVAAFGEALPFADASFDVVLSDNVVDHAHRPEAIASEIVRVLAPGGLLYFTVHVHHRFWDVASRAYGAVEAAGFTLGRGPFADHTVHLTPRQAAALLDEAALDVLSARVLPSQDPPARHAGDWVKRVFYKNATYELVARKRGAKPGR